MKALFGAVLEMSLSAVWIIAAVMILRVVLKKAPRWICCILWAAAALRLVCPAPLEVPVGGIPGRGLAERIEAVSETFDAPAWALEVSDMAAAHGRSALSEGLRDGTASADQAHSAVSDALPVVWAAGTAAMLAYALISYLRLRKTVSAAGSAGDGVKKCDELRTPFILGVFDPVIYIPSGMDETAEKSIILHEKAHIRRMDPVWKPLGWLILSVHWFNPLVWTGFILFCRDIELACDEKAVGGMDAEGLADYSQALLDCGRGHRLVSACPLAFGGTALKERVRHVLNYKKPSRLITAAALTVCAAAVLCFMISPSAEASDAAGGVQPASGAGSPNASARTEETVRQADLDGSGAPDDSSASNSETMYGLMDGPTDLKPEALDVPEVRLSSVMVWPCGSTRISSPFGESKHPVTGEAILHDHMDIAVEKGDPVYAAAAGTVTYAGWDGKMGYTVRIAHAAGSETEDLIVTGYSHLDSILVSEGDEVAAGDVIGEAGATGMATGPCLAFTVIVNGEAVDPMDCYR